MDPSAVHHHYTPMFQPSYHSVLFVVFQRSIAALISWLSCIVGRRMWLSIECYKNTGPWHNIIMIVCYTEHCLCIRNRILFDDLKYIIHHEHDDDNEIYVTCLAFNGAATTTTTIGRRSTSREPKSVDRMKRPPTSWSMQMTIEPAALSFNSFQYYLNSTWIYWHVDDVDRRRTRVW